MIRSRLFILAEIAVPVNEEKALNQGNSWYNNSTDAYEKTKEIFVPFHHARAHSGHAHPHLGEYSVRCPF